MAAAAAGAQHDEFVEEMLSGQLGLILDEVKVPVHESHHQFESIGAALSAGEWVRTANPAKLSGLVGFAGPVELVDLGMVAVPARIQDLADRGAVAAPEAEWRDQVVVADVRIVVA